MTKNQHQALPPESASFRVGTDIGGTFTDIWVGVTSGPNIGQQTIYKTPSTADSISGILDGLKLAAQSFGLELDDFCRRTEHFGHGSTVGINALLTGKIAKTLIITTRGFKDTIEIGRIKRLYAGLNEIEVTDMSLRGRFPPIVPRSQVLEVPERIDSLGKIVQPLDDDAVRQMLRRREFDDVQAVAICTLWSTLNPAHELKLAEIVRKERPDWFVGLSHQLCPVEGEYIRMSTTAVNVALGPVMTSYLSDIENKLDKVGMNSTVSVMTGSGGIVGARSAAGLPVSALFSGPVAGVMACQEIARQTKLKNVLTIDAGGTSFDAGLIVEGTPLIHSELQIAGTYINYPSIDVGTVGAGGGSIASVEHGDLRVGPQSAGADPGPACYGKGGKLPTTTDANLLLGTLDPDQFLDGRIKLDVPAARKAILQHVGKPLGYNALEAAWGIRRVFESKMADLLRRLTIERGHDPRQFTIIAGGGSGPAHAGALCREIGVKKFVVPACATAASAFGTGISDVKRTARQTISLTIRPNGKIEKPDLTKLNAVLSSVAKELEHALKSETYAFKTTSMDLMIGVCYRGQTHELSIAVPSNKLSPRQFSQFIGDFETAYDSLFGKGAGYKEAGYGISYVLGTAIGHLPPLKPARSKDKIKRTGRRDVIFDDPRKALKTTVYSCQYPAQGQTIKGPAIIEFPGHTVVVPPRASAQTDGFGNLHVRLEP